MQQILFGRNQRNAKNWKMKSKVFSGQCNHYSKCGHKGKDWWRKYPEKTPCNIHKSRTTISDETTVKTDKGLNLPQETKHILSKVNIGVHNGNFKVTGTNTLDLESVMETCDNLNTCY